MPLGKQLIILSGYPTSGKTRRAEQLATYCTKRAQEEDDDASPTPNLNDSPPTNTTLHANGSSRKRKRQIQHISDHTLHIPRSAYSAANTEKTARATLYSAAKRALAHKDDVVVLDAMNYIKGFRYQLHCEAKNARAGWAVVHVGVTEEESRRINDERLACVGQHREPASAPGPDKASDSSDVVEEGGAHASDAYNAQVHAELLLRFEEPNGMARWDSPLYTVVSADEDETWCKRIWDEVVLGLSPASGGKEPVRRAEVRPNQAAVLPPSTSSTHLQILERTTSHILSVITTHQRESPGDPIVHIPLDPTSGGVEKTATVRLPLTTSVSFAQLQRAKRQFVVMHRVQMGGLGMGAIGAGGAPSTSTDRGNGGTLLSASRAGELFVDYLNDWFETLV